MSFTALKGDPVNALVRGCLLEDRTGEASFTYTPPSGGAYSLKWSLNNSIGIVFVAVYQRALKLQYVDGLLERVDRAFAPRYRPDCRSFSGFNDTFHKILRDCEAMADAARHPANGNGGPEISARAKEGHALASTGNTTSDETDDEDMSPDGRSVDSALDTDGKAAIETLDTSGHSESATESAFNSALLNKKMSKRAGPGAKVAKKADISSKAATKKASKPAGKQARRWDTLVSDSGGQEDNCQLDFTEGSPNEDVSTTMTDFGQRSLIDVDEVIPETDEDDNAAATNSSNAGGLLSSFVRSVSVNLVGTAALKRDDIAPALAELKKKLMERNVAEEIAEKLTESVATSLVGQRLGSFTRVSTAVRDSVEAALTRILTPKRSIDVLREVRETKSRGRPYVIVFVGVNGVGKSTNLAKVAYWLRQNGQKVMIAACDTFRSGAVEQLRTHCARLNVPLYERGYEKDPAKVAFEGAKAAAREGADVLLVDTAGRMQDNEPLMRALSNLIVLNDPDLVLFVGEALVGNDAVDQLTKFNRRLADLAPGSNPHVIDGIVLTKFDTIDEKVGAALSMVYTSGAPIMFVGCGQTYVDLKRLNVKSVVHSLLK